jgi:RNA polymerase sigma-70 factor (ECF subfamily)
MTQFGNALGKVLPEPPLVSCVEPKGAVADEWADVLASAPRHPAGSLRFDRLYRAYFDDVCRWVRALGGPDGEHQDLVQDVFVVVHRRLADFDGDNLPGWLYKIAQHRVRDFRRLRWFRMLLGSVQLDDTTAARASEGPEAILDNREKQRLLANLLSKLPEYQRVAFVLFEIEGYSGEQIARLQRVPLNTVWARIRKARTKLAARAACLRRDC